MDESPEQVSTKPSTFSINEKPDEGREKFPAFYCDESKSETPKQGKITYMI